MALRLCPGLEMVGTLDRLKTGILGMAGQRQQFRR
jgi:hypothetical protein